MPVQIWVGTTANTTGQSMRGIFNFGRAFRNEAREFGVGGALANLWADVRQTVHQQIDKHWSNGLGGSMSGFYLLVPFTRLSMWVEWRDVSVGFGHERGQAQWEFFAGRLQGVLCIEPGAAR